MFFFRGCLMIAVLAVGLFPQAAFAGPICSPSELPVTASCISQSCSTLGTTTMDANKQNLVACLRNTSGDFVWKSMTSNNEDGYVHQFGTNGYQKLPSGMVLQWGYEPTVVDANHYNTPHTVTFPIPFPTNCTHFSFETTGNSNHTSNWNNNVKSISPTQAVFHQLNGATVGIWWFAIGY